MKSKLTLRLDEGLKERAKRLAEERGTSVSKIVEDYFRLLLRDSSDGSVGGSDGDVSEGGGPTEKRPTEESAQPLSPRVRKLKEKLGKPAPDVDMDEDTRRWVEAAAQKHA
ncbi:hypothetical protein GGP78_003328 [Salinibacter ruber]|uniref:ribbon-helix-helix domain-containing protein n=1 Tax=Salinibacter ruber TaxID=146919 RepID=UPI002167062C|nr:ribbon-helix-helix domain-containing protein [Salinibacter ruber]MCS3856624.1 hypothetical protein [Salinibacter ruber]